MSIAKIVENVNDIFYDLYEHYQLDLFEKNDDNDDDDFHFKNMCIIKTSREELSIARIDFTKRKLFTVTIELKCTYRPNVGAIYLSDRGAILTINMDSNQPNASFNIELINETDPEICFRDFNGYDFLRNLMEDAIQEYMSSK